MENTSTYKGFDLETVTMDDLFAKFPEFEPIIIEVENEISDNQFRIQELYAYAEYHQLTKLIEKLEATYDAVLFSDQ